MAFGDAFNAAFDAVKGSKEKKGDDGMAAAFDIQGRDTGEFGDASSDASFGEIGSGSSDFIVGGSKDPLSGALGTVVPIAIAAFGAVALVLIFRRR